jgi:hypothetical protein
MVSGGTTSTLGEVARSHACVVGCVAVATALKVRLAVRDVEVTAQVQANVCSVPLTIEEIVLGDGLPHVAVPPTPAVSEMISVPGTTLVSVAFE